LQQLLLILVENTFLSLFNCDLSVSFSFAVAVSVTPSLCISLCGAVANRWANNGHVTCDKQEQCQQQAQQQQQQQ